MPLFNRHNYNVSKLLVIWWVFGVLQLLTVGLLFLYAETGPNNYRFTETFPRVSNTKVRKTETGSRVTVPAKPAVDEKGEHWLGEETIRMEKRLQRVTNYCSNFSKTGPVHSFASHKNVAISRANNFLHCAVTKAASTFWYRFLKTLNTTSTMASPYSQPLASNMGNVSVKLDSMKALPERTAFVKSAFRSLFVRDPYTRMFSAYVDKAFAPNPTYWHFWGRGSQRYLNKGKRHTERVKQASKSCGSNVTFQTVMLYANGWLVSRDMHFLSATRYCDPCQFRYDFIGKMETFSRDVILLSHRLNLSITSYLDSQQFRYDYVKDAIEDSINSPFLWMKDVLRCMSKQEAGLRIWRKLQIRGIISRRIPFPYTPDEFHNVTAQELIHAALDAWSTSTDREELKQQKRDAFLEAYSSVDMNSLEKLTIGFQKDFDMFGYDARPPDVFRVPVNITRGAFDWWKEWVP